MQRSKPSKRHATASPDWSTPPCHRERRRAGAITVGIWISDYNSMPVVQIDVPDTAGRFRINVNDAAIWDQDTRTPVRAPPADA